MGNKFKINSLAHAIDFALRDSITIVAKDANVWFKQSFAKEGFTDENFKSWKPRKNQIRSSFSRLKKNNVNTKPTLVKSGKLKNSIKINAITKLKVILSSNLPYSAIHNDGLNGKAWGKYPFKMPKRQYMGNSRKLERMSVAKIISKIKTAIKNV